MLIVSFMHKNDFFHFPAYISIISDLTLRIIKWKSREQNSEKIIWLLLKKLSNNLGFIKKTIGYYLVITWLTFGFNDLKRLCILIYTFIDRILKIYCNLCNE